MVELTHRSNPKRDCAEQKREGSDDSFLVFQSSTDPYFTPQAHPQVCVTFKDRGYSQIEYTMTSDTYSTELVNKR